MSKLVLIIDDSATVRKVIEVALGREGYEVQSCASAESAIGWLKSPQGVIPDLFLVDLCLPKMDGYECIRLLRKRPAFYKTPIVIISRRSGLLDLLKGKLLGATDHLVKPFLIEELLPVVQRYLGVPVLV